MLQGIEDGGFELVAPDCGPVIAGALVARSGAA